MKHIFLLLLLPIGISHLHAEESQIVRSLSELRRLVLDEEAVGDKFAMDVTFVARSAEMLFVEDSGDRFYVKVSETNGPNCGKLTAGDNIHITGEISVSEKGKRVFPSCKTVLFLKHGATPVPYSATSADLATGKVDYRYITVNGVVKDVFVDEIDPGHVYLYVDCDGQSITTYPGFSKAMSESLGRLIGAKIRLVGFCDPRPLLRRDRIGRFLYPTDPCEILSDAAYDPFAVPDLLDMRLLSPKELSSSSRCRVSGRIIAIWNRRNALIQAQGKIRDEYVRVSFATPETPQRGEQVEASGFPGTDLYEYTLRRAVWRTSKCTTVPAMPSPFKTSIRHLRLDNSGRPRHHPYLINRLISLHGHVRAVPNPTDSTQLLLEDDGFTVNVDASSCPKALNRNLKDCEIIATGYLIPDVEEWSPNNFFPEIQDLFLVIRSADDLTILTQPPWWTPLRLFTLVIVLFFVIAGVLFWNLMLRRIAERRGRELAEESVSHAEANMRTYERTRLAVELHDALSQNLTGVAMRIQAAEQYANDSNPELKDNLNLAERALMSCCIELKNCLWDLRNQALEEQNLDDAIRLTLKPCLGNVTLMLRFNVPRSRLTDNTMHTLLRIIRELVVNGIQHGQATVIRIAGSIEGNVLKFSVADNGCGFDPKTVPGVDWGHFGIEGIRERVRMMAGEMEISSSPGMGAKTTISIHMPKPFQDETEYQD